MAASRLHLVRHGEVHNPARVLYGRLPDYHLSDAGRGMAAAAADHVAALDRPVSALYASPLERAQESAEPFAETFDLAPEIDIRLIEPTNVFEGTQMRRSLMNPLNWWHLRPLEHVRRLDQPDVDLRHEVERRGERLGRLLGAFER